MKPILATITSTSLTLALTSCGDIKSVTEPTQLQTEVIKTHHFNPQSFTQGLEVDGTDLLVGTGLYGSSDIYRASLNNPDQPQVMKSLPSDQFGEGITKYKNHIWQLTWKEGVAYKRDAESLEVVDQAHYEGEGWGLCATSDHLIFSDGTDTLRIVNPETFAQEKTIKVTDPSHTVDNLANLNELECVGNVVYANQFMTDNIFQINVNTATDVAKVTAVIDASNLKNNAQADPDNVLNGIAALPNTDKFLLTGKRWPDLYEVRFVPKK